VKYVFADTCYWVALTDRRDAFYPLAKERSRLYKDCFIVTSDTVFVEYLGVFAERGEYWRRRAAEYVERTLRNPHVHVVPRTHEDFMRALALYRQRLDKEYSLVDCDSMNIMRSRGIVEVLTEDHHFRQEGFVPLIAKE
jgi:predicted nucleic acid-binding protein